MGEIMKHVIGVAGNAFRRPCRFLVAAAIATTSLPALVGDANAEVIYRENFANYTGATQQLTYAGWNANRGPQAQTPPWPNVGDIYPVISGGSNTRPALPSINSNPAQPDNAADFRGSIYFWGPFNDTARSVPYLIWTDEYTIDRSQYDDLSFRMSTQLGGTDTQGLDNMRAAVRIGGNWFVTDVATQPAFGSWANSWTTGAFSASESLPWNSLTFTVGSPFAIGSPVELPDGNIEAFGVFATSKTLNLRIGGFEVEGTPVPEPAALSLLAASGLILTRRSRRRSR